jgi:hypothetical protein
MVYPKLDQLYTEELTLKDMYTVAKNAPQASGGKYDKEPSNITDVS